MLIQESCAPMNEERASSQPERPALDVVEMSAPPPASVPVVGDVVAAREVSRPGRARVRWCDPDGTWREEWLRTLTQLGLRAGDRVLLVRPFGWSESLVTGVVDGFAARPEVPPVPAMALALQPDESVRITTLDGAPLVELRQSESGPVVRLFQPDVAVEVAGSLRLAARSIELRASAGSVAVDATDAVVIKGESVRIN